MTERVLPLAHNPNDKLIGSAVFAQLTAECRRVHWGLSAVSCAEMAEPIDLLFWLWAKGSTSSIIIRQGCQCAHTGGHIGATWQIQWNRNRLSAAAMRPDIKLL